MLLLPGCGQGGGNHAGSGADSNAAGSSGVAGASSGPASGAGGSTAGQVAGVAGSALGGAPGATDAFPCESAVQDSVDSRPWPELFIGTQQQRCSDAGTGTAAEPFCNPHLALQQLKQAGTIVTFLDGDYRLDDFPTAQGDRGGLLLPALDSTAEKFLIIRAATGARPVLLGSVRPDHVWVAAGTSPRLFRLPVDSLREDTKALFQVDDLHADTYTRARRFRHVMATREGVRSHADVAALSDETGSVETSNTEDASTRDFTWTKADLAGAGCTNANEGCFIYLRAESLDFDPNAVEFEISQYNALGAAPAGAHFLVVDGLHTRFTQCGGLNCSLQFEGSDHLLIQNGSFGHVANSDDNSYALALWRTNASIVRNNRFFDSAYWGGTPNSKGLTFMISGATSPNWVCGNEIFHIAGSAGLGSKGGVSSLNVVGNHFHDSTTCLGTDHAREQDGVAYTAGNWLIRQNVFERCSVGVELSRNGHLEEQPPDLIINNVFVDNRRGVNFSPTATPGERVHNNLFLGGELSNACAGDECGAGIYFANNAGEVRDFDAVFQDLGCQSSHNAFSGLSFSHGVNRNWTDNYANYTLAQFQEAWGAETGSLATDPGVDADWQPTQGSPLLGAGLGEFYGRDTAHIGLYPLATP